MHSQSLSITYRTARRQSAARGPRHEEHMLILKDRYPGQTDDTDPSGYPHGKARNASSIGSGDGTPLEQDLINDIQGAMQALAAAADVTPSGDPERAD